MALENGIGKQHWKMALEIGVEKQYWKRSIGKWHR
jgi:hypothetical protein